jgi:hypothetical protein
MKTELPPPLVGEHSRAVLLETGFDIKEIDALIAEGVIHETLFL